MPGDVPRVYAASWHKLFNLHTFRTEHILAGDTWIPKYQWQDAINAYRNGTATQEQLQLLKDEHWQAP